MADTIERIKSRKPIILIVDDVPRNIQVLGTLLSKFSCELAVAMNGQQALDTAARVNPDLILLDVMMPVMDGHETCRRLKSSDKTKDIPVIFLTAKTESDDIVEGFRLGAVDYITKPFIGSELLARVETHLSLKRTKENLHEEVSTKNKFFSIISHDLRGAFGIILNFVEILEKNRGLLSKGEEVELLNDIGNTSKNTLELLENLLEWARSQTGTIKINPEMLNLSRLVSESFLSFQESAENKQIKLKGNINPDQFVFADRNMILLVIRNLTSNAIKFTPTGGEIVITSEPQGDFLKILVSDNGVGIEPERITKLFNIDKKVSTYGTNNEQGTGLGLILCKEFVEHNGGTIVIESELGKGTTISFTLPLKK